MEGVRALLPGNRVTTAVFSEGDTSVYLYNVGDFQVDLVEIFGENGRRYLDPNKTKVSFPSNSMLITNRSIKMIVDPGDSARMSAQMPATGRSPAVFAPLIDQLTKQGVDPNDITHVVVTHLHDDHFAGVTKRSGEGWTPSFPSAIHLIPKRDWQMPEIVEARNRPDSLLQETVGVIEEAGLIQFVDGSRELASGISLQPSPGESPGHQIVSLSSGRKRCYCVGDLYHVREEVEHPELAGTWTDSMVLLAIREEFAKRASFEEALILSGHMEPGTISLEGGRPRWSQLIG